MRSRLAGAVVVLGLLVAPVWIGLTRGGRAVDCEWRIGFMGGVSGPWGQIGIGVKEVISDVLDDHGAALTCAVSLESLDTAGDRKVAKGLAKVMAEREPIVVFGPLFRYESENAWPRLLRAGIPVLSSAGYAERPSRSHRGWFRYVPFRDHETQALANYLRSEGGRRIAITGIYISSVIDRARAIRKALDGWDVVGPIWISGAESGEEIAAAKIVRAEPDTTLFLGDPDTGAFFMWALKVQGGRSNIVTDESMLPENLYDPPRHVTYGRPIDDIFRRSEGEVAGTVTSSPWMRQGDVSIAYGPETRDVALLLVSVLDEYRGDPEDTEAVREHIVTAFSTAQHDGEVRDYAWDADGELIAGPGDIWFYRWTRSREITPLGHLGAP